MHKPVGEVIAAQIRRYRRQREMSVRQLAEECARIAPGSKLSQGALTNIERDSDSPSAERRGRREVTVEEMLIISAALRVPPILLICPFDATDPFEVIPGSAMSAVLAMSWITGKHSFPGRILIDLGFDPRAYVEEYQKNANPIRFVTTHAELWSLAHEAIAKALEARRALHDARRRLEVADADADDGRQATERDNLEQAEVRSTLANRKEVNYITALLDLRQVMEAAGLHVAEIPPGILASAIAYLNAEARGVVKFGVNPRMVEYLEAVSVTADDSATSDDAGDGHATDTPGDGPHRRRKGKRRS